MVLGRFCIEEVEAAFRVYMETKTTMPKPADIVKIIEPPVEPKKWCKVTFLAIKRKHRENVFTSLEEDKYIEDFLKAQVSAPEEQRSLIEDATRQAVAEDKKYWSES